MLKRSQIVITVLAVGLCAILLSGCGGGSSAPKTKPANPKPLTPGSFKSSVATQELTQVYRALRAKTAVISARSFSALRVPAVGEDAHSTDPNSAPAGHVTILSTGSTPAAAVIPGANIVLYTADGNANCSNKFSFSSGLVSGDSGQARGGSACE